MTAGRKPDPKRRTTRGRPYKDPKEARTVVVSVKVTPKLKRKIDKLLKLDEIRSASELGYRLFDKATRNL